MIEGCLIIVYMDDILIFTPTEEELNEWTCRVLQILKDNNLYLKLEKCEFRKQCLEYLDTSSPLTK
jgi:hypothetical protein